MFPPRKSLLNISKQYLMEIQYSKYFVAKIVFRIYQIKNWSSARKVYKQKKHEVDGTPRI